MTFWKLSNWWPCEVSPFDHTHTHLHTHVPVWLFDFNCVAVKLLWMMSKCIKKKGWVVTASTTPLCNLGGLYQGFACRPPHYPNLFNPLTPAPLFNVLCLVGLRIAIVFSAPCHPPPPSVFFPQCKYMQYRGHAGDPWSPGAERHLPSASTTLQFSEAARDCPVTTISSVSKLRLHPLCRLLIACTG